MRIPGRDLSCALALVACAAGCGSYTTYQTAEPMPRGRWQGAIALGVGSFADPPSDSRTPSASFEIGARRGVGRDTDVGLKLYTIGFEASVRHRFATAPHGWSFAGLLAIGGLTSRGGTVLPDALGGHVRLTAIATKRTSARWAYSFGPLATSSLFLPAGGGRATGVLLGAFANLAWTLGDRWHLVPELSLHRTIAGDVPVDGSVAQLGIGLARDW
jgi:hypothetical protein